MNAVTKQAVFLGTGRRKEAVARIRLTQGSGEIIINGRSIDNYCGTHDIVRMAVAPLVTSEMRDAVDIKILVHGGGPNGQAGAISHGIARALESMNADLRGVLKKSRALDKRP